MMYEPSWLQAIREVVISRIRMGVFMGPLFLLRYSTS
jgi:hypothetical protein